MKGVKSLVSTCVLVLMNTFISTSLYADLARDAGKVSIVGDEGSWVMENAAQLEQDGDGKTWSMETGIQHTPRVFPRVSFLLETILQEWDKPKNDQHVSGYGDTDFTVSYLLLPDDGPWPAIVIGSTAKFATADNHERESRKTDYVFSLIIGKEFGELDVNLEVEFETFSDSEVVPAHMEDDEDEGIPPEKLEDQFLYTLSLDYGLTDNVSLYAEVFGNTEEVKSERDVHAAGAGLEIDFDVTDYMGVFVEAGVDTDHLIAVKIGMEWKW